MTRQEFLRRCETIYDMGFFNDRSTSTFLQKATDCYMRMRSAYARDKEWFQKIACDFQGGIAVENIDYCLDKNHTLAADKNVYNAQVIACILDHPCQLCAEAKNAWHTRYGFCDHSR